MSGTNPGPLNCLAASIVIFKCPKIFYISGQLTSGLTATYGRYLPGNWSLVEVENWECVLSSPLMVFGPPKEEKIIKNRFKNWMCFSLKKLNWYTKRCQFAHLRAVVCLHKVFLAFKIWFSRKISILKVSLTHSLTPH